MADETTLADLGCSYRDCGRAVRFKRDRLCNAHGLRLARGRDMDAPIREVDLDGARGSCTVAGCDERAHAKNYCQFHYRRSINGVDLEAEKLTRKADRGTCQVTDCDEPCDWFNYCQFHGYRMRTSGDLTAPKLGSMVGEPCKITSCFEVSSTAGLCVTHYGRKARGVEDLDTPFRFKRLPGQVCSYHVCTQAVFSKDLCNTHYDQMYRNGRELTPVKDHFRTDTCVAPGCAESPKSWVLCVRHQRRADKFKLSPVQLLMFLDKLVCEICGDEINEFQAHLDHDHACCPNKNPCGKCNRGWLCRFCNHGLGNFRDDLERLDRAAEYLRRTTTAE